MSELISQAQIPLALFALTGQPTLEFKPFDMATQPAHQQLHTYIRYIIINCLLEVYLPYEL